MKKPFNDGGQAFPCGYHPEGNSADQTGMSMREWYAGQLMPTMLARNNMNSIEQDAEEAVNAADALIAELAKERQA